MLTRMRTWFLRLRRRDLPALLWQWATWLDAVWSLVGWVASGLRSLPVFPTLWLLVTAMAWAMLRALNEQIPVAYAAPRFLATEAQILIRRVDRAPAADLRRVALLAAVHAWERDRGGNRPGPTTRRDGRPRLRVLR